MAANALILCLGSSFCIAETAYAAGNVTTEADESAHSPKSHVTLDFERAARYLLKF